MAAAADQSASQQFILRTSCLGHQEDVRGLAVDGSSFISASRDRTVKVWAETGPNSFTNTLTLVGHQDYVGAVAVNPDGIQAKYVTGSRDKTVRLWNSNGGCLKTLQGHKWQITAVLYRSDDSIVSASLDGTIRDWNDSGEAVVLEGHQGPVQCLALLPDGSLLSGSNDKTIRRWLHGACQQTITGHQDTVRGLAVVDGLGFVSASHDTTLRVWTGGGESVATLVGHSALVYSAASGGCGLIASGSEDNTARVWRPDGSCLQVITHAACVWDVVFLANGDLVTACADFASYVWTVYEDRVAAADEQQAYLEAVEARKVISDGAAKGALPEGLKVEDPMALTQSGSRDGQTIVVREGAAAIAYSWSEQRSEWEKLGEVVAGPQDTMAVGNKQHANQSWDYVFDVDIADGALVKKLAANMGEDPYTVADRFLEQEQLPLSYREQIAQFVVDNSRGGITHSTPSFSADPFTGATAYVPTGGMASGRVRHEVTGGGYDPFTGSAAPCHVPDGTSGDKVVPQHAFVAFKTVPKVTVLADKVRDLGQQIAGEGGRMSAAESTAGGTLDTLLSRLPVLVANSSGKNGGSNAAPSEAEKQLLTKLLRWPSAQLFPVLDVARLLALDPQFAGWLADSSGTVASLQGGLGGALATAMTQPQSTPNQQTGLRLACNAFMQPALRTWISGQMSEVLDGFSAALISPSKAVRLGAATLLLNCAVLGDAGSKMQVLSGLLHILSNPTETDVETVFRAVTAAGTLMAGDTTMCSTAKDIGLAAHLSQKQQALGGKVASVAKEVLQMLG